MWYNFESKFSFGDSENIVDVEFSHCDGKFVISAIINEAEKFIQLTNDENRAKNAFSKIVEYLQGNQSFDLQKLKRIFEEQED